jgi:ornithine carbamoyltransferase
MGLIRPIGPTVEYGSYYSMRNFLDLIDLNTGDLLHLLSEAARLKTAFQAGDRPPLLAGRVLGMIFEKQSLRTRVSFEAGMAQLGGRSIFLSATDGPIGQRESVPDFARTLSEYVDVVAMRVFSHKTLEEFAAHSRIPSINGLSDLAHPCQALGDLLTIQEVFGSIKGRTVVFVGDGNNVARSLALACGKLGARFVLSAPEGYRFDDSFLQVFRRQAPQGELTQDGSPSHAVANADVIYTDVWTSMGQEAEHERRLRHFAGYQVDAALLAKAPKRARLMHCLPAHRGEEVSAEAIDGDRSIVFQQAGNRMHAQKAVLVWLLT